MNEAKAGKIPVQRALISVYDKAGLEELARGLHEAGVEIVSTGTTAATIASAGIPVMAVAEVTGFPEILGGRVKTLHPYVHAGLLANQGDLSHMATIAELGIKPFQLVIVNLYPFAATVASRASGAEIIEQIDIGGPAMVRASAKNHGSVAVVTDPAQYGDVLVAVRSGGFTLEQRRRLARDAFRHTAAYDIGVASWFGELAPDLNDDGTEAAFPSWIGKWWKLVAVPRYGENPHQRAVVYGDPDGSDGVARAEQLGGKAMSFNNYGDIDAAVRAVHDFAEPCVAIIKHANPCGIAVGADVAEAHRKAYACDPVSAFGGVIATNREVTVAMAEQLSGIFTEVIAAPGYEPDALVLLQKKSDLRILLVEPAEGSTQSKLVSGGLLVQDVDKLDAPGDDPSTWTLKAGEPADAATLADLAFAWRACRSVKSNGILAAHDGASIGIGMGQVNRVDSCKLVVQRGGERVQGSVAASDAYFPFADGLQVLIDAGVRAVVQPGGSKRDDDVITAATAAGVTMYFTGTRHFAH